MTSAKMTNSNEPCCRPPDLRYILNKRVAWSRFCNTFLQAHFLFDWVIRDEDFDSLLAGRRPSTLGGKIQRLLEKSLWFWPRIVDATEWATGSEGRLQTPDNYVVLDRSSELVLNEVMRYAGNKQASILDLCCNSGRHLNALYKAGYRNLSGVDAMGTALERFRSEFPDTAACAKLSHDLLQRFIRRQPDLSADLIYSHGATLELIHPAFEIVRHICRVARQHVVLYVYEHGHAYPRWWIYEFRRQGFYLVRAERPAAQFTPDKLEGSLLVFQRIRSVGT